MNRLTELANKYKSDKGTNFNAGNHFVHGFTKIYNTYFKQFEGQHPYILEIGVYKGASIKMIHEYYNGNCEIYCFDIDESCKSYIEDLDNVHFYNINQGDSKALEQFIEEMNSKNIKFNIILDDGSHALYHQILSMLYLYKLVDVNNGYYIVEDCHTAYDIPQYICYKYIGNSQVDKHGSILEMLTYFYNPIGVFDKEIQELFKSIKYVLTYNNTEQITKTINAINYKELQENRSITCIIKFINKGEA